MQLSSHFRVTKNPVYIRFSLNCFSRWIEFYVGVAFQCLQYIREQRSVRILLIWYSSSRNSWIWCTTQVLSAFFNTCQIDRCFSCTLHFAVIIDVALFDRASLLRSENSEWSSSYKLAYKAIRASNSLACVAGGSGCVRGEAANSLAGFAREGIFARNSTRLLPILLATWAAFCTRVRDRSSRG